jgi:hypothetical protein
MTRLAFLITYFSDNLDRGWDGRIRTCECRDQNPVPYHLATSHHNRLIVTILASITKIIVYF